MAFVEKNTSNRHGASQVVAYDASVTTSVAFGTAIRQARVVATTASHFKVGETGLSAATTDPMLPANWIEYVTVNPGQYVAFIKISGGTAGVASVTDVS